MEATVGKILLRQIIPQDLHHHLDKDLDAKALRNLTGDLAEKHPDKYKDVIGRLTQLGFETSTRLGSSVGVEDLAPPSGLEAQFAEAEKEADAIKATKGFTKKQLDEKVATHYIKFLDTLNASTLKSGLEKGHTLAKIIRSGSRGSPAQYRQTVSAVGVVPGPTGKPLIDFPITRSYAQGLSPGDYLATSFGTRHGAVGTKLSVAESGYLSKQLFRALVNLKVELRDCGTKRGIPVPVTDKEYVGSFLALPANGFNHNNEVTLSMLKDLEHKGVSSIVVRSPLTCEASNTLHHGALCQLCVGRRDRPGLMPIGNYIGVTAGTTGGERLSQGQLGSKHSGSAIKKQTLGGFALVNQLLNIPDTFRDKAPVSEGFGKVVSITKPAQGGHHITIQDKKGDSEDYYVGQGTDLKVKVGDMVEPGDILSDGVANPADVVRLKGIGEGRVYLAHALKTAFSDAGLAINKRNLDLMARSAVNHVKVTSDGIGHFLPNEVVSYSALEKEYHKRPTAREVLPDQAIGMYLEEPVLHHTIGTLVTGKIADELRRHHVGHITVHEQKPGFEPEMQRLLDAPAHEEDWMHQLYTTYIQKRFLDAVNQGAKSDLYGGSPIAALAAGTIGLKKSSEVDFADVRYLAKTGEIQAALYSGQWYDVNEQPSGRVLIKHAESGSESYRTWDELAKAYQGKATIKVAVTASRGCLMAQLPVSDTAKILRWSEKNIPEKALTADGRERSTHCTVIHGFDGTVTAAEVQKYLGTIPPLIVKLGKITRFKQDKGYDVLVVKIESDAIKELHEGLKKHFGDRIEVKYPVYRPHVTLAYVTKDSCPELDDSAALEGEVYEFDALIFSEPGGSRKTKVTLKGGD